MFLLLFFIVDCLFQIGNVFGCWDIYKFFIFMNVFYYVIFLVYKCYVQLGEIEEVYLVCLVDEFEVKIFEFGFENVIGFFVEFVVGFVFGVMFFLKGYFFVMDKVIKKYGMFFIMDEVMSGLGWVGQLFVY